MAGNTERCSSFTFGGVEYTVSMSVQNGGQLTVQVEEHSSADQWRNTFDANCQFPAVHLYVTDDFDVDTRLPENVQSCDHTSVFNWGCTVHVKNHKALNKCNQNVCCTVSQKKNKALQYCP